MVFGRIFFSFALLLTLGCQDKSSPKVSFVEPPEQIDINLVVLSSLVLSSGDKSVLPVTAYGDRLLQRVNTLRRTSQHTALVLLGNTFTTAETSSAEDFLPLQDRAVSMTSFITQLSPLLILRGKADLGIFALPIERAAATAKLPLLSPPKNPQPRYRLDSLLWNVSGFRIGLLGAPGSASLELPSYVAGAAAMRAQGAKFIVALMADSVVLAKSFAEQLSGIDVVVAVADEVTQPEVVDGTLIVGAPPLHSEAIGLLGLHRRGNGSWVFDAQSPRRAELLTTLAKTRLSTSSNSPPSSKNEKEQTEETMALSEVTTQPEGSFVTWQTELLSTDAKEATWVRQEMLRSLKE